MRRGASMPELLVAMLVLLVGIWVVAAKFPKLAELMTEERTRDKMTRKAEQAMEDAKQALPSLPSLVAAYGATSAGNPEGTDESVSPYYDPAQPLNWFDNTRPVNCVENTLNVFGETFRVPGPPPQTPIPAVWQAPYFLRLGPAAADVQGSGTNETIVRPRVYQPIPLTRDDTIAPTARVAPAPGAFCLRDDGVFRLCLPERDPQGNPFTPRVPSNSAQIEVSYTWVDKDTSGNQRQHQTCGELLTCTPDAGGVVTWTSPAVSAIAVGGEVVPNSATATFRYDYKVLKMLAAGPETRQATDPPGAWLDWQFGHAVWFDASEEGKTLCVDYRLRTYLNPSDSADADNGRRLPLAREVHRVPDNVTGTVAEVPLDYQFVDDQTPLVRQDLGGTALTGPHVVAFDLETGASYSDTAGTLLVSYLANGQTVPGWIEGRVSFGSTSAALGRNLIFYYRTLDKQTVQLQRAAATFTENLWRGQSPAVAPAAWALGRWYYPSRDGTAYDPTSPTLYFPRCTLTLSLRIEYLGRAGRTVEVHTLGQTPDSAANLAKITLDDPVPGTTPTATVLSVSGYSVRTLATWFARSKLRAVSVETLLTGRLEPSLAREPYQGVLQP